MANTAIGVDWVVGQHRDQRWLGRWPTTRSALTGLLANTAISVDWAVSQHRNQRDWVVGHGQRRNRRWPTAQSALVNGAIDVGQQRSALANGAIGNTDPRLANNPVNTDPLLEQPSRWLNWVNQSLAKPGQSVAG